jgi:hypothetical protein
VQNPPLCVTADNLPQSCPPTPYNPEKSFRLSLLPSVLLVDTPGDDKPVIRYPVIHRPNKDSNQYLSYFLRL